MITGRSMKTWTLPAAVLLSLGACQGSTQRQGVRAPPPASSNITSGATADAGAEVAPAAAACESATACDACLSLPGCNWTGDRCLRACLMDTSCIGPGNASAPRCPAAGATAETDAGAPAAAIPLVGLRTLAFREGAHPPVGAHGAHGATVWAVTLTASAGPSPELNALFQQTQAAHLAASVGDLNCTPAVGGSYPSTIPTGDGAQVLTVTFRSERDARQFAAALTETPLRTGRVRVMCAD